MPDTKTATHVTLNLRVLAWSALIALLMAAGRLSGFELQPAPITYDYVRAYSIGPAGHIDDLGVVGAQRQIVVQSSGEIRILNVSAAGSSLHARITNPLSGDWGHMLTVVADANGDAVRDLATYGRDSLVTGHHTFFMLSGNQSPGSVVSGDTAALFTLPFGNILPRWAAPVPEAFEFLLTEFPGTARRRAVTGAVLHTVTGASIANGGVWVGDLNADGSPDYLTGGDSYPASVPLHVISGIDTVNGTAASRTLRTFSDPVTPGLGYAEDNNNIAAAIGDISGDGVTEIAVGSRLYRIDPDGTNYGRVVVFNGSTGAVLYRLEPDQTHTNGVYFGNNIVAIPDVNADGFDDFVVSARGYGQGGFGAGALIAYSAIDGTELFRVYGNPGEGIGDYEVVSLEDLNGDALPDLAVGSLTQASIWLSRRLVSPANTAVGTGVSVTPSVTNGVTGSVSLVFDNVVTAGETTATASSQGQPPPAGFKLTSPPVYYEIETTAEFTGNVRVCLAWTDGQVANENYVHIFHREGDQWVNITDPGSLDTASNRVCGTATSLSPFAMFEVKYQFTGFYAPVDNPPVVNVVKAGSSIPVKFSLGGALGLSIFASGYPRTVLIQCATGAPMDVIEETSTAGASGLSYNSSTGQYQYNWKTDKAWDGSCRQLQLQFNDGEVSTANFSMSR